MAAKKTSGKKKAATYSIGEWYGNLFRNLGGADQKKYAAHGGKSTKVEICRFRAENPELAPAKTSMCTKKGGVCSIRRFEDAEEEKYGPLVATCPSRFYEDGLVIKAGAKEILGTDDALVVKEVPFLRRTEASEDKTVQAEDAEKEQSQDPADSEREDVGRIDMVLVHPNDPSKWCALEIQAVYFSGDEMGRNSRTSLNILARAFPSPSARGGRISEAAGRRGLCRSCRRRFLHSGAGARKWRS